jgi:trimeric autotransporter adhesin
VPGTNQGSYFTVLDMLHIIYWKINLTKKGVLPMDNGCNAQALGPYSYAEGSDTIASGFASHAEGFGTVANSSFSHTEGENTTDNVKLGVHVVGQNGGPAVTDPDFSWYLVNGALGGVVAKILNKVDACFEGTLSASVITPGPVACDYAEMFEISGDEWIDVGYFVTFDNTGDKIRKARASDDYIVGITSSNPGFLADIYDPSCSKFLLNKWNQPIYQEVVIPAVMDSEGKVIMEERKETTRKLNPNWDPNRGCRSRLDSVEWVPVGLLGKLLTRDDGSCKVNGYCWPNNQGIATASTKGYRVMKRTGLNQILVLLR